MKVKKLLQTESVLCIAVVLALASMLAVRPDRNYGSYIDWRTLAVLFSLMTVTAGLRRQGVFDRLGRAMLARMKSTAGLVLALVGLCFFGSMLITNDVALITFVPFALGVLGALDEAEQKRLVVPVVAMQTLAANLGSMLTPVGNPQNLYLYARGGLTAGQLLRLMGPYTLLAGIALAVWARALTRRGAARAPGVPDAPQARADGRLTALYAALFALCLLAVLRILPYQAAFFAVLAAALLFDRKTLRLVDYSLLATFAALFVFIGNLGRLPALSALLARTLAGREVPVAVAASQVMSNVPAALLLAGFSDDVPALLVGTNLGGLGTLIASMASLISYRLLTRARPGEKGRYLGVFTVSNLALLALELALWAAIG